MDISDNYQNNEIKIVTWNVNGIRSRIFNDKTSTQIKQKIINPEEGSPMHNLISSTNADIICIQETRCDTVNGKKIIIPGYTGYFNESKMDNARGPNRYSGTAIFTKINPNKIEYDIPDYNDQEGRIMIMHFDKFLLINVYVPNSGTNYDKRIIFNQCMLDYFDKINVPIIFTGDMNMAVSTYFDKSKVKPSAGIYPHELKFYDDILSENLFGEKFIDTLDKTEDSIIFTWWNPLSKKTVNTNTGINIGTQRYLNQGWRLDYIFTRGFKSGKSKVLKNIGEECDPQGSDHAPVYGILSI